MKVSIPDMSSEIIEAIHLMYEDDPDTEALCYAYLSESNPKDDVLLGQHAYDRLADMECRCCHCGGKLETYSYKEYHPEVDANCYEVMTDVYCPYCDTPLPQEYYGGGDTNA